MLARIRVTLPDRPGALGSLCSAIGGANADVDQVDVLASATGRATDDLRVAVHNRDHLDRVLEAIAMVPGMVIEAVQAPVSPLTGFGELELIRTVMRSASPQTLADQAAASLEMGWAAVLELTGPASGRVAAASVAGPAVGTEVDHPVRLSAVRQPGLTTPGTECLMVPLGSAPAALLLCREGASFHVAEMHRLAELGRILGELVPRIVDLTTPVPVARRG